MTVAKRRFVLYGLVVVNLLALMVIAAVGGSGGLVDLACQDIFAAQCVLLPIWAVLGTSSAAARVSGSMLGCAAIFLFYWLEAYLQLSYLYSPYFLRIAGERGAVTMIDVLVVTGALVVMRLAGLRMVRFTERFAPRESLWPQFSLKSLLSVTAAVAVVLCLGNFLRSIEYEFDSSSLLYFYGLISAPAWIYGLILAPATALLTCAVVWAALCPAPSAVRVSLANLLAVPIALATAYFLRVQSVALPEFLLGTFIEAIWLSGSLLVIRACGYRLIWPADWVWAAGLADEL